MYNGESAFECTGSPRIHPFYDSIKKFSKHQSDWSQDALVLALCRFKGFLLQINFLKFKGYNFWLHRCWWRMFGTKCVGDKFGMLVTSHVTNIQSWVPTSNISHQHHLLTIMVLVTESGDESWGSLSVINIIIRQNVMLVPNSWWRDLSPTSQTCHQHIWSPTTVTNIDVTILGQNQV